MDQVGQLLLWSYVPKTAADFLIQQYYKGRDRNEPQFQRNYRIVYALVVCVMLGYNFYSAYTKLPPNYYHLLDARVDSSASHLRARYRELSLIHHPDKTGEGQHYLLIRQAYDTLKDPMLREAYERLGHVVCTECRTLRDFLVGQIPGILLYYLITGFLMGVLYFSGIMTYFVYWRAVLLLSMFSFELTTIFGNNALAGLFPSLPRFQLVLLAREAFSIFTLAVNQLGPVFFPHERMDHTLYLYEIEKVAQTTLAQSEAMFQRAVEPVKGNTELGSKLVSRMEQIGSELEILGSNEALRKKVFEKAK
ncbi:hypothetical protein EDD86DRAFT_209193 [Gorgonomyces haynaldii]|nr:hypothetical protein EDD86DRAFT_209193 [Gorgonomyces haynaldii]